MLLCVIPSCKQIAKVNKQRAICTKLSEPFFTELLYTLIKGQITQLSDFKVSGQGEFPNQGGVSPNQGKVCVVLAKLKKYSTMKIP